MNTRKVPQSGKMSLEYIVNTPPGAKLSERYTKSFACKDCHLTYASTGNLNKHVRVLSSSKFYGGLWKRAANNFPLPNRSSLHTGIFDLTYARTAIQGSTSQMPWNGMSWVCTAWVVLIHFWEWKIKKRIPNALTNWHSFGTSGYQAGFSMLCLQCYICHEKSLGKAQEFCSPSNQ